MKARRIIHLIVLANKNGDKIFFHILNNPGLEFSTVFPFRGGVDFNILQYFSWKGRVKISIIFAKEKEIPLFRGEGVI